MIDYIRNQIKKRRVEKRLTQSDVAVDLGITAGAYSKIESGPTALTIEKLAEIADILEVDITYFFQKKTNINKTEDGEKPYGFATKGEVEELARSLNRLTKDVALIKAALPKAAPVKKKKKA